MKKFITIMSIGLFIDLLCYILAVHILKDYEWAIAVAGRPTVLCWFIWAIGCSGEEKKNERN